MSTQSLTLTLTNDDMRFEAVVGSGHTIVMDNGAGDTGARPSELLGVALAGCTAMDVISILRKKRQAVTHYEVRTSGQQVADHPHNFTRFDIVHVVDGDGIDPAAVAPGDRAVVHQVLRGGLDPRIRRPRDPPRVSHPHAGRRGTVRGGPGDGAARLGGGAGGERVGSASTGAGCVRRGRPPT